METDVIRLSRRGWLLLFLLYGVYFISVQMPEPRFNSGLSAYIAVAMWRPGAGISHYGWLMAALPLVAFLPGKRWVLGIVFVLTAIDVYLTVFVMALDGTPANMAINGLIATTAFCWAFLLASIGWRQLPLVISGLAALAMQPLVAGIIFFWPLGGPILVVLALALLCGFFAFPNVHRPLATLGVALPVIWLTMWSLSSGIIVGVSAQELAGPNPYCIAADPNGPSLQADYEPIGSVFALRGANLYTARTGYKSTSRWYFHALLLVDDPNLGRRYWNWSIKKMRFDPIEGDVKRFISRLDNACRPRAGFLKSLGP